MKALTLCVVYIALVGCGRDEMFGKGSGMHSSGPDQPSVATSPAAESAKGGAAGAFKPVIIDDVYPDESIDSVIAPLIDQFKADAALGHIGLPESNLRVVKVVKKLTAYSNIGGDTLAFCVTKSGLGEDNQPVKWQELEILDPSLSTLAREYPDYRLDIESIDLRRLVYHELGHCLLHKGHGGNFVSMMAQYYVPLTNTEENWKSLTSEMFSQAYQDSLPDLPETR